MMAVAVLMLRFGYSNRGQQPAEASGFVALSAAEIAVQQAKIPP